MGLFLRGMMKDPDSLVRGQWRVVPLPNGPGEKGVVSVVCWIGGLFEVNCHLSSVSVSCRCYFCYSMVILSASFWSCRVGHLSSTSISLILGVFLCQVKVNLAVLHRTFCQCPFFMWIPHPTGIFEDGMHKGQVSELLDLTCTSLKSSLQEP